jgi:hypothetical protein
MVKWSAVADPGTLPPTWDESNPSFDAGEFSIGAGADRILDGCLLGDALILYMQWGVWGMQFVGGTFIFRFWQIYEDRGILGSYCVAEFEGKHFVVGQDSIYIHDTQQLQDIGDKRIIRFFFSDLNQSKKEQVFVLNNQLAREIWIMYPDGQSEHCNKALIWDYRNNVWSLRLLPKQVVSGAVGILTDYIPDFWEPGSPEDTWPVDDMIWNLPALYQQLPVMLEREKAIRVFDVGDADTGSQMVSVLERRSLELPSQQTDRPQDVTSVKFVYTIWPKITGTPGGVVNVFIGGQMQIDDEPNWQGPIPFTIGTSQKIDCRASGRLLSFRFESNTDISWKVQSLQVGYKEIAKW